MDMLNDDCILIILKNLNLSERTSIRLASKRYKNLCDSIKIKKLIVYYRIAPLAGRLKYVIDKANKSDQYALERNLDYTLQDTVYVFNIHKFFSNEQIIHQMKSIEILAIHSGPFCQIELNHTFDHLKYLELNRTLLNRTKLLESSKLEYLILNINSFAQLEQALDHLGSMSEFVFKLPFSFYTLCFEHLKSKRLKFLSINTVLNSKFYHQCVQNQLLNSIEQIDLVSSDFTELIHLNKKCSSLKVINIINPCFDSFFEKSNKVNLEEIANDFREDLTVYLYGIKWDRKSALFIPHFFKQFHNSSTQNNSIQINEFGKLNIIFNRSFYDFIKKVDGKFCDLSRFYGFINSIHINGHIETNEEWMTFFKKLVNIDRLEWFLGLIPLEYFEKLLNLYGANLKTLFLYTDLKKRFGNEFLNLAGEKCKQLEALLVHNFVTIDIDKLNFEFILKFPRLRIIKLLLSCPIEQDLLIELIRELKHLTLIDICFPRPKNMPKEQLSLFKRLVNDQFKQKFDLFGTKFTIEIHSKEENQFIRYYFCIQDYVTPSIKEHEKNVMHNLTKHLNEEI